jgi:hypothetical protein
MSVSSFMTMGTVTRNGTEHAQSDCQERIGNPFEPSFKCHSGSHDAKASDNKLTLLTDRKQSSLKETMVVFRHGRAGKHAKRDTPGRKTGIGVQDNEPFPSLRECISRHYRRNLRNNSAPNDAERCWCMHVYSKLTLLATAMQHASVVGRGRRREPFHRLLLPHCARHWQQCTKQCTKHIESDLQTTHATVSIDYELCYCCACLLYATIDSLRTTILW